MAAQRWGTDGAPQTRRAVLCGMARVALGAAVVPSLAACGAVPTTPKQATSAPDAFTAPGPAVTDAGANPSVPKTMYSFDQSGHIQLIGFGSNIFGTSDEFSFLYAPASGDGQWTVRVDAQENTSTFAKAGLMVRATTAPNSPFVDILAVPGGDAVLPEWRDSVGASASRPPQGPGKPVVPLYLRLTKKGQGFTLAASPDGSNWSFQFPHESSAFGSKYLIGLAACSASSSFGLDVFSHLSGFTPSAYAAIGT